MIACTGTPRQELVNPRMVDKKSPEYVNPFAVNTYEHFVASKEYPTTMATYSNSELVNLKGPKKQKVIICIQEQRGRYYVNDQVAIDFPVSTGVKSYPTKTGEYKITEKKPDHSSNLYGRMYDAEGKCIDGDANSDDPVPEGGKFVGSPMPYWMRMTGAGLGMHVGRVARRPLSHGCIRLQKPTAKTIYERVKVGTPVSVRQTPEEMEAIPVTPIKKKN